ncbi:MAG TPA: efflux RND transporter periplasmic adaptor subunit, partial [Flavihumibacter sp.]|nr:efflux RND transporter periplasmic adaptor subunit [Flavihumibacter sp.]
KINIPAAEKKDLYAGMYATVAVATGQQQKSNANNILVPQSAIVNKDQLTGLYTVGANNIALLRWVRLGKTQGNAVEVISGLSKDESFIASADGKLYNGAPVKIK